MEVSPTFSGVTLNSLPVTGAMQNSYIIRFTNVSEFMDGLITKRDCTAMGGQSRFYDVVVFCLISKQRIACHHFVHLLAHVGNDIFVFRRIQDLFYQLGYQYHQIFFRSTCRNGRRT